MPTLSFELVHTMFLSTAILLKVHKWVQCLVTKLSLPWHCYSHRHCPQESSASWWSPRNPLNLSRTPHSLQSSRMERSVTFSVSCSRDTWALWCESKSKWLTTDKKYLLELSTSRFTLHRGHRSISPSVGKYWSIFMYVCRWQDFSI